MPSIDLQGHVIAYRLRRSNRARRISIRFMPQSGFEIVYPREKAKSDAMAFFQQKQAWVLKTWIEAQAKNTMAMREQRYVDGAELLYFGDKITLKLHEDGEAARFSLRDSRLEVVLPQQLQADQRLLRNIIEVFYRQQAKRYLPPRTRQLAQLHGFSYNQVRIKNQKTRWGSCSSKRNINLNLRLMMAPDAAIDYVIIHELCHLRELNHSAAFWALVESYCPKYRQWEAWFKRHGPSLIL
ncbi:MAG: SprT family zinc-dependent metalloprotease [Chloroflexota bacterium]|nr:SprT family zinc-dependent metalloprotease [Chloroflexota bacterium]